MLAPLLKRHNCFGITADSPAVMLKMKQEARELAEAHVFGNNCSFHNTDHLFGDIFGSTKHAEGGILAGFKVPRLARCLAAAKFVVYNFKERKVLRALVAEYRESHNKLEKLRAKAAKEPPVLLTGLQESGTTRKTSGVNPLVSSSRLASLLRDVVHDHRAVQYFGGLKATREVGEEKTQRMIGTDLIGTVNSKLFQEEMKDSVAVGMQLQLLNRVVSLHGKTLSGVTWDFYFFCERIASATCISAAEIATIVACAKYRFSKNQYTPEVSLCLMLDPQNGFKIPTKLVDFADCVQAADAEGALDLYVGKLEGGKTGVLALQILKEFNLLRSGAVYSLTKSEDASALAMVGQMSMSAWYECYGKHSIQNLVHWVCIPLGRLPATADRVEHLNSAYRACEDGCEPSEPVVPHPLVCRLSSLSRQAGHHPGRAQPCIGSHPLESQGHHPAPRSEDCGVRRGLLQARLWMASLRPRVSGGARKAHRLLRRDGWRRGFGAHHDAARAGAQGGGG